MKLELGPKEIVVGTKRYPTAKVKGVRVVRTSASCLLMMWGTGSLLAALFMAFLLWPELLEPDSEMPWLLHGLPLALAAKGAFFLYLVLSHVPQWKVILDGFGLPDEAARFDEEQPAQELAQQLREATESATEG